ncbi:MAG: dephospho-CoA kinase [Gemmatimonadaceae bacterium]
MVLVGLTGNIASGKSTVGQMLRERGAYLIDADVLAREAVAPGTEGLRAIRARWGEQVILPNGTLDRAALRRIVFGSDTERDALNAIVHPEVERLRTAEIEKGRERGEGVVVCDIPLHFEKQLESRFDLVMLVDAPEAVRLSRLTAFRGLDAVEARAMMGAQMSSAEKRARADIVIDNDGSLDALRAAVNEAWHKLT